MADTEAKKDGARASVTMGPQAAPNPGAPPRSPRVAIDGPAGAGKSTVAKRLAERLGYLHVDTGALYRTVAFAARRAGAAWDDEPNVARVAEALVQERRITRSEERRVGKEWG